MEYLKRQSQLADAKDLTPLDILGRIAPPVGVAAPAAPAAPAPAAGGASLNVGSPAYEQLVQQTKAGMTPGTPEQRPGHHPALMAGGPTPQMWTGGGAAPAPAAGAPAKPQSAQEILTGMMQSYFPTQTPAFHQNFGALYGNPRMRPIAMQLLQGALAKQAAQQQAQLQTTGKKELLGKELRKRDEARRIAEAERKAEIEDREDRQQHERDLAKLREEGAGQRAGLAPEATVKAAAIGA
ncbi:MAG: hypothetical protein ACYS5V_06935, partial [Planctomycetota bacterium]